MTTNNAMPAAAHPLLVSIGNVESSAKRLYRSARRAGTEFSEVEFVVHGLYTALKHLKVEAEDPDSLLYSEHSSVYAIQLTPIVKECDYRLKLLDAILEKFGGNNGDNDEEGRITDMGKKPLETEERDMIDLIRTKLANEKLNIDAVLDTVQLHNPSKSHQLVNTNDANLESIKDKVDTIAARITQRNDSISSEGDDELWLQFRDELEKEGFSRVVLRKNQDVLRAYIRQLDEHSMTTGGKTPTVRGFLEGYPSSNNASNVAADPFYPEADDGSSAKEMYPSINNEKFSPGMKVERMHPEQYPPYPSSLPTQSTSISYDPRSSDDGDVDDDSPENSMALVISTRDLMALDKREADLAIAMDNMRLQNPHYTHGPNIVSSPQGRYLPPPANAGLLPSPTLDAVDQFGLSPRFLPPVPPPPYDSSPPPTLHHNSISAPAITGGPTSAAGGQTPQRYARLAPDSLGRDIPLDAHWTRIKRSLISPEVLNQAGVRYEARPDFVAILGVFTKEDLTEFARRSAEVRKRRGDQQSRDQRNEKDRYYPEKYKNWDVEAQQKNGNARRHANSEFSSSSDLYDSSDLESDEELPSYRPRGGNNHYSDEKSESNDGDDKGTKIYPFIVSPPDTDKEGGPSPSATVKPKPILKNKNDEPHVRFDPAPKVLDSTSPRSVPRHSERSRDEKRSHERSDRDRYISRSHDDRDTKDRDRDRDRDDEHRRHSRHHSDSSRRRERDRDDNGRRRRRDERDRDRHRDRDDIDKSEDRSTKKKARGETLRAVGIGGAAASLLSVLTEAAAGL